MVQARLYIRAVCSAEQIALILLLYGCASHKPVHAHVVIENSCITSLNVTPKTYCEIAPNGQIDCHHATVTYTAGCAKVVLPKSK